MTRRRGRGTAAGARFDGDAEPLVLVELAGGGDEEDTLAFVVDAEKAATVAPVTIDQPDLVCFIRREGRQIVGVQHGHVARRMEVKYAVRIGRTAVPAQLDRGRLGQVRNSGRLCRDLAFAGCGAAVPVNVAGYQQDQGDCHAGQRRHAQVDQATLRLPGRGASLYAFPDASGEVRWRGYRWDRPEQPIPHGFILGKHGAAFGAVHEVSCELSALVRIGGPHRVSGDQILVRAVIHNASTMPVFP